MSFSTSGYELLIQSVEEYAIYMLDPDGRVVSWNPGARRIKGYADAEIIGEHFSRFYTPEDLAAGVPAKALDVAQRQGRYTAEGWRCRKDGSRFWASVVIGAIRGADGKLLGFAKVTRDLTEWREAQSQLEQSREQLFQAQKMEAVGHLTSGLAHDFNNLLAGMTGSLELLKRRLSQGRTDDLERHITAALGAASRGAALTHRLLAFARRQTLNPTSTNVNTLIADMEELVRRTVGPEIRVETVLENRLWATLCDPHQLESAILNLCINARDAMPDGGRLRIETANVRMDENDARAADMRPGLYVSIRVVDTGTGMPPEVVAQAFNPLFTTKPPGRGTGLGLSMVYGFARLSGGQVRIRSEVGAGTTVCIYMPRHWRSPNEADAEKALIDAPRAADGDMILIVDDDAAVRMLMTEMLQELGYGAIEAADAESGLKVLESDLRIDLLIADIGLPGVLNGRQMTDLARQLRPRLKVLFVTGYAEKVVVGNDSLDVAMHILTKPFALETLASTIRAIIAED